jgi:hypothetical protein
MTRDFEASDDWLKAAGVTHVGMESTGVYWWPVYSVQGCPSRVIYRPQGNFFVAEVGSTPNQ